MSQSKDECTTREPSRFEQMEQRIRSLSERVYAVKEDVCQCADALDGSIPQDPQCNTEQAGVPDTIFGKIGMSLQDLELTVKRLEEENSRLKNLF